MAIGWWLDTGIYSKMASDVGHLKNWTTEWTQPSTRELESVKLSHVLILFIIFGAMILLSMFVFGLEVLRLPSQGGKRIKKVRAGVRRVPTAWKAQHVKRVHVANDIPEIV